MQRRTIWENADSACPIIGTCLTVPELRRLCRKCGMVVDESTTDYEAHTFLVKLAKEPGSGPAKHLQRFLDKKYHQDLRNFLRCDDEAELRRMWRQRADAGDIPGPFWALLSHPLVRQNLLREVCGEVHMLSHRVGAGNRADLSRLAGLENRLAVTAAALEKRKTILRQAVTVWKDRCQQAMGALVDERNRRQAAEREYHALHETLEHATGAAVQRERDIMCDQLLETTARLGATEAEAGKQAARIEQLDIERQQLRQELADRDSEVAALEASLFAALGEAAAAQAAHAEHHTHDPAGPVGHDAADCPGGQPPCVQTGGVCACPLGRPGHGTLQGKRVLYVGGRSSLVAYYKGLAEKFGCELLHHDGGREQSCHRLWALLGSADAVVCPVDCVSHEACLLVKQACKGCLKPLVLARSSGLSSLARSLTELGGAPQ